MKKRNYKLTCIFLAIGFVFSAIIFLNFSSLKIYFLLITIFTFIFGSVGWTIDRFKPKKIITILLILLYFSLSLTYFFVERSYGHCQSFNFIMVENLFIKECKCLFIACYSSPLWYLKEDNVCELIGGCDWRK